MEELYIYSGTKKLRCGYTTGTCAAAAAKAAAIALLTQNSVDSVDILTPKGIILNISVSGCIIGSDSASCCVIKDSGDDPDVTNGIEICAEVTLIAESIEIIGGKGIGTVTKKGLDQPVGEAAINSVPRKMITQAVEEAAELHEYCGGFRIVVSVPHGEELAKKTFNPRIGIVGGISIIGTTGIVEPMSDVALIETIRTEANIRRAEGRNVLVLTVGNYSERFVAENKPQLTEQCVMCSNFIGDAIDIGITLGFRDILICGHIGKLVKLGSGIMNTHSSYADGRMETIIACGAIAGVDNAVLRRISDCATTDAALDILAENGSVQKVLEVLGGRIHRYLQSRANGRARVGAIVFSYKNDFTIKTDHADEILRKALVE